MFIGGSNVTEKDLSTNERNRICSEQFLTSVSLLLWIKADNPQWLHGVIISVGGEIPGFAFAPQECTREKQ